MLDPGADRAEEGIDRIAGLAVFGMEGEKAFLDGVDALKAPDAGGDFIDNGGFDGADGPVSV